jgi:hypothetical protein
MISRIVASARLSVSSAISTIEAVTVARVNRDRPHRVRMIDRHGSVITIAGTGVIGADPDFEPASIHTIGFPAELTVHPDGRVFFSDTCSNFVNYLRALVPVPF